MRKRLILNFGVIISVSFLVNVEKVVKLFKKLVIKNVGNYEIEIDKFIVNLIKKLLIRFIINVVIGNFEVNLWLK